MKVLEITQEVISILEELKVLALKNPHSDVNDVFNKFAKLAQSIKDVEVAVSQVAKPNAPKAKA